MKIKKGDVVEVLSGAYKGKKGAVMRVLPQDGRVIVDGVNVAKRSQRATKRTMQGGIIDKDMPIQASNVAITCSHCGPTRIGFRTDEQGRKVRVCRKCGGDL
ncbi:MAG TPA: 50S ribosomal protein L24 [Acidimicrobiales bacterium]|nr:50S ribosomal protein L24 [Acidimicrobiales bacterium]